MKFIFIFYLICASFLDFSQAEVTLTLAYPDHPDYFIYSIPPADEQAKLGGEYYVKIANTGSVDLNNWQLTMNWKTLNSTWGTVQKTVLNSSTGLIRLEGPTWDLNLAVGESIVLNGEWIPSSSIDDWMDYLPTNSTCSAQGIAAVPIVYDVEGEVALSTYSAQKVQPISASRKTFATKKIVAYFPLFDAERAWCSLQKYGDNIDELRVQLYSISPNGVLRAGQDTPGNIDPIAQKDYWYDSLVALGVVDFCQTHGIELVPVVYNYNSAIGDFDQQAVHGMLSSPALRTQHLNDLISLLEDHPAFDGIDIDYESLLASERENYAQFMEDLADLVHAENKLLTTAVHTKIGTGTWYGPQAQDYQRIGNAVDEITLMTYDLHWATSPTYNNPPPTAGCQATPDWMNDVAFFAVSEINNPSKIQIGLPFYGYRWKLGFENHTLQDPGVGLTYADAQELIDAYNPTSIVRENNGKEQNFVVNINGTAWTCYFQDSTSIAYKLAALVENDLKDYIGGIAVWRLGGEDPSMWNATMQAVYGLNATIQNVDCLNELSVNEMKENSFRFYPNPTQSDLNIEYNGSEPMKIQIVSVNGQTVLDEIAIEPYSLLLLHTDFEKGAYLISTKDSSGNKENYRLIVD
jgi:spore germination protein